MSLLFTNNAVSTLAAGIGTGDTSLTVQAAAGNLFPNPSGNDSFLCTLRDASNNIEIVECTSRSGDALTIVRAREGTTAKAYLAGDAVELSVTAGVLSQYRQGVGDGVIDTAVNLSVGASRVHDFINCTAALTITLADAATMAEGYQVTIKNQGTGSVTVNRATGSDTINGVLQDIVIGSGSSVYLSVNQNEDGYITMYEGFQQAYPVGAIYLSTVATNPGTVLGFGTWTQIAQGRTLIGEGTGAGLTARTAGAEIGQEDAIIPDHTHVATQAQHRHKVPTGNTSGNDDNIVDEGDNPNVTNVYTDYQQPAITVQNATGGEPVDDKNMQPSLVVYIFERTG